MIKKKYKSITFAIFLAILFYSACPVFAALEITGYPNIPGFTSPTEGKLETYVSYFFGFMCYIAGAIAMVSFAVGAVQLIMAASNPSLVKEGKDKMTSAILGLILTISAVIILKTINPALVEVSLDVLPLTDGIYYKNGDKYKTAPVSEANTSNIPSGYETLYYKCSSGPALLIWKFPKTNFAGNDNNYRGVTVVRKKCGDTENLSNIKSFKTSFETSGIYYCMAGCNETGTVCSGYMSESNASSGELSAPFKNNLKSIRVVNDLSGDLHYGIIFHSKDDPTVTSSCSRIFYSSDKNKEIECFSNISISNSSTVFFWNDKDYKLSGQGVDFYSEPFGWAKAARAGKYSLTTDKIKDYWNGAPTELSLDYTGITRPSGYKNIYQQFQQHAGSIKIKGNYVVILRSGAFCQVFFKDIVNLKSTEITATNTNIEEIDVIPVK